MTGSSDYCTYKIINLFKCIMVIHDCQDDFTIPPIETEHLGISILSIILLWWFYSAAKASAFVS